MALVANTKILLVGQGDAGQEEAARLISPVAGSQELLDTSIVRHFHLEIWTCNIQQCSLRDTEMGMKPLTFFRDVHALIFFMDVVTGNMRSVFKSFDDIICAMRQFSPEAPIFVKLCNTENLAANKVAEVIDSYETNIRAAIECNRDPNCGVTIFTQDAHYFWPIVMRETFPNWNEMAAKLSGYFGMAMTVQLVDKISFWTLASVLPNADVRFPVMDGHIEDAKNAFRAMTRAQANANQRFTRLFDTYVIHMMEFTPRTNILIVVGPEVEQQTIDRAFETARRVYTQLEAPTGALWIPGLRDENRLAYIPIHHYFYQ